MRYCLFWSIILTTSDKIGFGLHYKLPQSCCLCALCTVLMVESKLLVCCVLESNLSRMEGPQHCRMMMPHQQKLMQHQRTVEGSIVNHSIIEPIESPKYAALYNLKCVLQRGPQIPIDCTALYRELCRVSYIIYSIVLQDRSYWIINIFIC